MNDVQTKYYSELIAKQWLSMLSTDNQTSAPTQDLALRQAMGDYAVKSNVRGFCLWLGDYLAFFVGQGLVVFCPLWLKPVAAVWVAIAIARLYLLGHDAAHYALANSPKLNVWLGSLAFLPSLTAYPSHVLTHNHHHAQVNSAVGGLWYLPPHELNKRGDLWHPLSFQEYRSLGAVRRYFYRLYRSVWGAGFYALLEGWWHGVFFPSASLVGEDVAKRSLPTQLAGIGFWGMVLLFLYALAEASRQAYIPLWLFGVVLPFIANYTLLGFLSYLQHTHPQVAWHYPAAAKRRLRRCWPPRCASVSPALIGSMACCIISWIIRRTICIRVSLVTACGRRSKSCKNCSPMPASSSIFLGAGTPNAPVFASCTILSADVG